MVSYQLIKDLDYSGSKKAQPMSFVYARNPKSLVSYCTKEHDLFTNLSPEEIKAIPQWLDKGDYKIELKAQLKIVILKKLELWEKKFYYLVDKKPTYKSFCLMFHEAYFEVNKRYCFHRNTFYRSALEHKIISRTAFLEKIGVIDSYDEDPHYPPFIDKISSDDNFWREEQIKQDKMDIFQKA